MEDTFNSIVDYLEFEDFKKKLEKYFQFYSRLSKNGIGGVGDEPPLLSIL